MWSRGIRFRSQWDCCSAYPQGGSSGVVWSSHEKSEFSLLSDNDCFIPKRIYRKFVFFNKAFTYMLCALGPGSVVGIVTGYGLDGPGIESRWGEIFRTCPDRPWGPPNLLYNGYRVFPGVGGKAAGVWRWPLTPSSAIVKKEQSYTSTPPMGRTPCTEP